MPFVRKFRGAKGSSGSEPSRTDSAESAPSAGSALDAQNDILVELIKQLRPKLRIVLVKVYVERKTRQAVADELRISRKRLDQRLTRALRCLRVGAEASGINLLPEPAAPVAAKRAA